jgi:hypothetical protein
MGIQWLVDCQSFFVYLRFTLSQHVTECPYQLPSHCSSLFVLLSVDNSLNAHINFPLIVRLSTFYSQSTIHWRPISTSRSLVVSQRFTLSPQVTECPYQLPVIVRLSTFYSQSTSRKLIWAFSDLWTECKTERDEQWLGSWYGHSVTCGLRVKRRETNNDWEVDMGIQWLVDWEYSFLLSVHESLNAHTYFPVIFRLSTFYSQSTSHWMPISTS